ncbi:MAG: patatin-like phospholipase family protein [Acidimicrobiia bacterium]|nr:patatin-like phospholipase family protein [Acidimicrobiia bacterium]
MRVPTRGHRPRISIVLGGGWTLGGSFHAGVLRALQDTWQVDARTVDTIIGTSSGAVTAGYVGAGLSADDLFNREVGDSISDEATSLLARARDTQRPPRRAAIRAGTGLPAGPTLAFKAAADPESISPTAVLAGWLPRGTQSHRYLRSYFDELHRGGWPTRPQLRLCAVDLRTGRRVVIDHRSRTTPGRAIAASCALPGWHRPVKIGDQELIDGAVHSVDNSDAAASSGADVVIVSSPMSTEKVLLGVTAPLAPVRNIIRATSRAEQRLLEQQSKLVALRPRGADVRAMGSDLAVRDRRRRRQVAYQAYRTAQATFRRHQAVLGILAD